MNNKNPPVLALSVHAYLFFSIASVLSAPLAFIKSSYDTVLLFAIGLCITAVGAACAVLVHYIAKSSGTLQRWPIPTFFSQLALIGLVRGWAFYSLIEAFSLQQPSNLNFRLFNSVLTTIIWMTLASAVVEGQRRYLKSYRTLVNQAVFYSANPAQTAPTEASKNPVPLGELDNLENIVALKANLSAIHEAASITGISQESLKQAAASVRYQIESLLRPMSHRLWFNSEQGRPQVKIWGLMEDSLRSLRFSIPRVVIVCLLPTLVGGIVMISWQLNLLTVSTFTGVLLVCLLAYKRWAPQAANPWWNLLFMLGSGITTITVANLIFIALHLEQIMTNYSSLVVIVPLVIVIVLWADSTIILVSQDRKTISSALVNDSQIPSQFASQDLLASYLHNSLQSELTGIAYQLEHAAQHIDSPKSRQSLEQLGALIGRSISQDFANFTETPLSRIQRVIEAWSGIATTTITFDERISDTDPRLVIAVQIIEEGIANAVRHSGATQIDAELNLSGDNLVMQLTSDGSIGNRSVDGVGTKWLSRYAISAHEYKAKGNSRILEVVL